jgi:hypothetical protein
VEAQKGFENPVRFPPLLKREVNPEEAILFGTLKRD